MKLDAINTGLRTAAACALLLGGCDPGTDDGTSADTGANTDGDDTEDAGDTETEDDTVGDDTVGDETADADDEGSDDEGPMGMGEDPPVYECPAAPVTLSDGFFTIDDGEFNEITMLEGITIIDGNVDINRSNYNNLDFLQCITEITGNLTIFGNDFLVDASGLNTLEVLGGDFIFTSNNAITTFNGMNGVDRIYRSPNEDPEPGDPVEFLHSVVMNKNESLQKIEGWERLEFIFGNITIRDNPVLESIDGFKGLVGIGLNLAITANPSLCYESINCVGAGIQAPPPDAIPESWTTQANSPDC